MFLRVSLLQNADIGQLLQLFEHRPVDGDSAERRGERLHAADRDAPETDSMAGSQQHDPADDIARRPQTGIGRGRDRAGIDVAGVRNDDRLGRRFGRRFDLIQESPNLGL